MKLLVKLLLIAAPFAFLPSLALADIPSLQVAPLSYTGDLKAGAVSSGFVDVANPSDQNVNIAASVQAFKQIDKKGDLAFSDDPTYSTAIKVGLPIFELGPRQAIRVAFTIDPSKLPQGGVYAALFFRTVPAAQNSDSTYVLQSANVGTLLILTNGGAGAHRGQVTGTSVPFWQTGGGLSGAIDFTNTDSSPNAVAFKPSLATRVTPWGKSTSMTAGLLMPGVTRQFGFSRPGSFFGLLPVTFIDTQSGGHATAWVLAITGVYRIAVPVGLVILVLLTIGAVRLVRKLSVRPVLLVNTEGQNDRPAEPEAAIDDTGEAIETATPGEETAAGEEAAAAPGESAPALPGDEREVYGLNSQPESETQGEPEPHAPHKIQVSTPAPEPEPEPTPKPGAKVKLSVEPAEPAPSKPKTKRKRKSKRLDTPRD